MNINKILAINDVIRDFVYDLEACTNSSRGHSDKLVPTGLITFDYFLSGLRRGELIVAGGRPGIGKSSLACSIALNVAIKHEQPALFCSSLQSSAEIARRFLSEISKVDINRLQTASLCDDEWERLSDGLGKLNLAKLFVSLSSGVDLQETMTMVRSKCAEQGEIELIIFDSIEMFTQPMNTKPLRQQLNEVYAALKELALQMNVPVLVTSGLKPQLELRKNKRPMLTDFPHPEITERWADLVLALYSDAHYVPHSLEMGIIEINSIYNRNGPMGVMNFAFLREYCLVDDLLTTS